MRIPDLVNDIVGCIRGQMPLRHTWDQLPVRIQSMVRNEIATAIKVAEDADIKEALAAVPPVAEEPKPSRPRPVTKKKVTKK